jgi:hypothetical protein
MMVNGYCKEHGGRIPKITSLKNTPCRDQPAKPLVLIEGNISHKKTTKLLTKSADDPE